VYKVESLTFAEDGLVEVAGSYVPLTSTVPGNSEISGGKLAVLFGYSSEDFIETT